jgi:hypothetical protein
MAASLIQRSFAGGEIGPELYGRADQTKYQSGLKTCRNFQVMRHGGVQNRAGTGMIQEVKDSSARTYFIKFVYNDSQTYVIEVGNLYMRFYRAGARIVVAGVAAYNNATPYVIGDLVLSGGINYYCIAATVGNVPPNAAFWYPLTGVIYEIPTPYLTADIPTLQFQQSADVVTIEHANYDPRELTRTGHTTWKLQVITFAPSIAAPTGPANTGAAGAAPSDWVITAAKADTYEESLQSVATTSSALPTAGAPIIVSWVASPGAAEYYVYRKLNGVYGYIGVAVGLSFSDIGNIPNVTQTPPQTRNPFVGAGNFPATGGYYQQRRLFAQTTNAIEKIWTSRSAMTKNFSISSPLQADDAVTFSIVGRKVHEVRHIFDLGVLVVLTSTGEWIIEGDSDGVLRADQPPNPRQVGYNGANTLTPIVIANSLLYVQARGTIVRDLRNEVTAQGTTSYNGRDLTVFAPHLFKGRTLSRWDYSQIPHSIVWACRDDGTLIALTYLREHEVWGWHRHDTDGFFEEVCCVPEGQEDAVYVIVRRTINGVTKRYIERFASRDFTNIAIDAKFLDSHLTYDGRNTTAETMALSTGAGWTVADVITITRSVGGFIPGDIGNEFKLEIGASNVRISVTGYVSPTVVQGVPQRDVPVALRGPATATWTRMVDELAGLGHLEGKNIAAVGDGNVIANPNNSQYTVVTVAAGSAVFDRCFGIIHVGLPYLCDFETLDLDVDGQEIRSKRKNITHVKLLVQDSRGIFAGPDLNTLDELPATQVTTYDDTYPLNSGLVTIPIASTWDERGGVAVRQVDPLPLAILAAIPCGDIGG